MCLAIPGKILECQNIDGMRQGRVQVGGSGGRLSAELIRDVFLPALNNRPFSLR
jgi:hydrogenase maturation factor